MDNKDLKIFICSHKKFKPAVKNEVYEPIIAKDINNDTWINGLKGSFYSEIMSYFHVAENYELPKYVGFCQYRRYFKFKDDIPDMDEVLSQYDAIVPEPKFFEVNLKTQYANCHNIEDLYIVTGIIANKYPYYIDMWNRMLGGNVIVPYNMFITRKDYFLDMISFVKGVLDEYVNIVGTDIEKRIKNNKDKYIKDFSPNDTVKYQYRIGGYLAERLVSMYIMANFDKPMFSEVDIVEEKYGTKV